jgi:hypothetical protein
MYVLYSYLVAKACKCVFIRNHNISGIRAVILCRYILIVSTKLTEIIIIWSDSLGVSSEKCLTPSLDSLEAALFAESGQSAQGTLEL